MPRLRGNPWTILAVLSIGFFMTLLDLTVVNVAIPSMVDKLHASLDQILWVINAYTFALAVLVITAGRLGDRWGKKGLYLTGIAVFTVASMACALAQNPAELITFRAIQGMGAALLLPQTLSIIVDVFPPSRRGVALGIWGATAGLAGAAGPIVGGVLVTEFNWRWIFLVNVPLGIGVLAAGLASLPAGHRTVRHRFDVVGVLLATAWLFCLAYALIEGQRHDWDGWIWGLIVAAAVLLAIFFAQQASMQRGEPLLPFTLFRDRNFAIINFVGVTGQFGVIGLLLPLTIYLQSVLGYSALKAGLMLLPLAICNVIMAGPAGVLGQRFGGKYILMIGLSMFAGGLLWLAATAGVHTSWTAFIGPLAVMGLGTGSSFAPMAAEVMRNVPPRLTGAASGVNNALRQIGAVLAGAVIGAVLQTQLASSLRSQAISRAASLPVPYRSSFVHGFTTAASSGLQVGVGQYGTAQHLPAGASGAVARQIQVTAAQVFGHGFIDALRPAMYISAALLLAGAACCMLVKAVRGPSGSGSPRGLPLPDKELVAGDAGA